MRREPNPYNRQQLEPPGWAAVVTMGAITAVVALVKYADRIDAAAEAILKALTH